MFDTVTYVEGRDFLSEVPVDVRRGKVYLEAEAGGLPYSFVLDTGSPTILTRKVADALRLEIRGQSTGVDANGTPVTMDLAVLDRIKIGDVVFRDVPVFVFDDVIPGAAGCLFDGGVIGSELMPLANWQIDLNRERIVLASDTGDLDHVEGAARADLIVSGYPFMPVVPHRINGSFADNALFDTGNTEVLHLNARAFEELRRQGLVDSVSATASGVFGGSAGEKAEDREFYRVPLDRLSIGELELVDLEVWTRADIPSLIGARVLRSHVVTLDYSGGNVYFSPYAAVEAREPTFGFRPSIDGEVVRVGFLRAGSSAEEAGLQLHDQIVRIDGADLSNVSADELCGVFDYLLSVNDRDRVSIEFKSGDEVRVAVVGKD
ncbi:aspartyl protease family protein [Rubrivirga sp.]|uniref:aspartyl protease family protein n=1 Tax=Rubrivirga sp. TaxID=1885344 RepID=UPI003C79358D